MKKFLFSSLAAILILGLNVHAQAPADHRFEVRLSESYLNGKHDVMDFLGARAGLRLNSNWMIQAEYLQGSGLMSSGYFSQVGALGFTVAVKPGPVEMLASLSGGLLSDKQTDGTYKKQFAGIGDCEARYYFLDHFFVGGLARIIVAKDYEQSSFLGASFGFVF
ncbi:MAG: hypothetical protein IJ255_01225 [Bacteroidales bacterium]|nr:hypothetical protein [Bacteroidales bacterium]